MKKKLTFGLVALLGAMSLVGCSSDEESKATISKVKMSGISVAYKEGSTIDWSKLSITATYTDETTKTLTKFEYDVDSVAKSETEAVVYTEGLHAQSALTEGSYKISLADVSDLSKKYSVATITVGTASSDKFALAEFNEPAMKSVYKNNIKNAGTAIEPERNDRALAKSHETLFISDKTQYVVGTMNPFYYEPEVSFESLENPSAPLVTGDEIFFRKSWEVKELVADEYVAAQAADYSTASGYVQFNDSAIGKTFSITLSLTDFETVEGTTTKATSTFEGFKVQKGLNIYSAKELGILNVTNITKEQQIERKYVEHKNDSEEVFYDGTAHYRPDFDVIWSEFLVNQGVYTEAQLTAYADTPAVFVHGNIDITKNDIPGEYFIKDGEFTNNSRVGCLRDGVPLYAPIVDEHDVEVNGNFFSVSTENVPLCKCTWTGGFHPYVNPDEPIMPGHSDVFKFCGRETDNYLKNQTPSVVGQGIIRNLNSVGNAGTDFSSGDFEKMLTLTGLIFAKNDYCGALYDNIIIKQYQIGLFANDVVGQKYETHEQTDRTFVSNSRVYDCSNCGLFNYHNGGLLVTKSVFNRFGGAPLMNAADTKEYEACNSKFDKDVIFNNEITGEEVYFAALGPDIVSNVNHIKLWNSMFVAIGNNFYYEITDEKGNTYSVLNLVSIGLNGDDYHQAQERDFYSNIMLNYGETNQLNAQVKSETEQWSYFDDFYNSVYTANYNAAYAQAYPQYFQQAHDAQYPVQKEAAARAYLAQQMGCNPEDVPAPYVEATMADETFTAGFDAQFEPAFKAQFDEQFPAQFKAQFDPQFDTQFPKSAYGDAVPPVFQTEIGAELFWTDDNGHLYDRLAGTFSAQLNGEYLSILLPVLNTCFNLVFRISKIVAA